MASQSTSTMSVMLEPEQTADFLRQLAHDDEFRRALRDPSVALAKLREYGARIDQASAAALLSQDVTLPSRAQALRAIVAIEAAPKPPKPPPKPPPTGPQFANCRAWAVAAAPGRAIDPS
jgi:hypothetical protein